MEPLRNRQRERVIARTSKFCCTQRQIIMSVKVLAKNKNGFLLITDTPCQLVCMIVYIQARVKNFGVNTMCVCVFFLYFYFFN